MELPDPRMKRGFVAGDATGICLHLLNLVEDIQEGKIHVSEMFFCPAKKPAQRTVKVHGTWVMTLKGHGSGEPLPDDEDEFTGELF